MGYDLAEWEDLFEEKLETLNVDRRHNPGALLHLLPSQDQWDTYTSVIRSEWNLWQRDLDRYPACLIVLYGGLAFYEYQERSFWPHFAKTVNRETISPLDQTKINKAFVEASKRFRFPVLTKATSRTGMDLVGTSVYHVGIPLSLWEGFLDICEWALWQDGWDEIDDSEWTEIVIRRVGGRTRLKRFLIDNRVSATKRIRELLEARKWVSDEPSLSIADLAKACFLRKEYFDSVPETAEFLRPSDPESLVRDQSVLVWDERRGRIVLYLPGIGQNQLPATWCLDHFRQPASRSPNELPLNSLAFQAVVPLNLASGSLTESKSLRGASPWGLFDLDNQGRLVNPNRDYLPVHNYVLVSQTPLSSITRKGFDESDCPVNQTYELADGAQCFVTYLWPTRKFAELTLGNQGQQTTIQFRAHSKIEARFFVGFGSRSANFSRLSDTEVKIEGWPVLCLAIPRGYYGDNQTALNDKFKVCIDGKPAFGKWETREVHLDDGNDFYVWNWSKHPLSYEQTKSGTAKSFQQLAEFYRRPRSHGKMALSIQAPGFSREYRIYKDDPKTGMEKCWEDLPGAFLPWFLLCQTEEGMKWDDLLFAGDVIAPGLRLSAALLRKYEKEGFFVQKGIRWKIAESRASLADAEREKCRLDYCGDPSVLWRFYRWMSRPRPEIRITLPDIEVVNKRGEVPYLSMSWELRLRDEILQGLKHMNVRVGSSLWNH